MGYNRPLKYLVMLHLADGTKKYVESRGKAIRIMYLYRKDYASLKGEYGYGTIPNEYRDVVFNRIDVLKDIGATHINKIIDVTFEKEKIL
jgi:hypothetical protein